jgi:hypothetical protein
MKQIVQVVETSTICITVDTSCRSNINHLTNIGKSFHISINIRVLFLAKFSTYESCLEPSPPCSQFTYGHSLNSKRKSNIPYVDNSNELNKQTNTNKRSGSFIQIPNQITKPNSKTNSNSKVPNPNSKCTKLLFKRYN